MNFVSINNPVWANQEQTAIVCDVVFELTPALAGRDAVPGSPAIPPTLGVPAVISPVTGLELVAAVPGTPGVPAVAAQDAVAPTPAVLSDPWPFTASPDDTEEHGPEIFAAAKAMGPAPYVAPPPIVPQKVSRRQLLIGLQASGYITGAEAVAAAATGVVPALLQNVLTAMTAAQQIAAQITWAAMTDAYRNDPLLIAAATAAGKTSADLDALFIACSAV